ncbi:nucleotide exchange factor GrpE [Prevotella sp. P4-119]|uniref:nucleotide exchange factor GrpE n=1 Tax=Prevotella sp. P4-119 TaxID=2024218 RepID=UPI000B969B8A|nr:nucleotide exchange factor GrpE [Prevotella sp. P4-119]OYP44553.1 nucleotide exchange factor GrpE [Prevotella sp. P4-119]
MKENKEEQINCEEQEMNKEEECTQQESAQQESAQQESADNTQQAENENPEEEEEKDPLAAAQEEIEQLKDQVLRKAAEFENLRKRTIKEKAELILNGGEKAIVTILPIIDDMERAIENGTKTDDPKVLREGMEIIYHKCIKALESLGVKTIDTTDADFDTDEHEAVAMVPGMGDDKKGKVIDCIQTGYKLNDKVIRHAKVAVGQ